LSQILESIESVEPKSIQDFINETDTDTLPKLCMRFVEQEKRNPLNEGMIVFPAESFL
jgi:hypothetical protein